MWTGKIVLAQYFVLAAETQRFRHYEKVIPVRQKGLYARRQQDMLANAIFSETGLLR
jgi:hypothetical protein